MQNAKITKTAKPTATKTAPKAKPAPKTMRAATAPKTDKQPDRAALVTRIATERKTANDVFTQLSNAISIPIKTLAAFERSYKRDVTAHAIGRKPSPRQAAALYVALKANGGELSDNVKTSRKFEINGAGYAIENGALSSAIASGLCSYDSASETITIRNAAEIQSQIKTATFRL